ncbi:MAG: HEPN domain-containing protein [Candidatus Omnitrophica bacterium]|nr:HEPN domain-containing protein [Candidatus Omnitrophota bacterium]
MKFEDLIRTGQLKKEVTNRQKLEEFVIFAENELSAANFNLDRFTLTAYKSAYDALLHAGNALIRYHGYRPTTKYTHATITEFVDRVLGKEYGDLVRSFKRMRKKRHPLQYEAVFSESREEVKNSIIKAEKLVKKIKEYIKIIPRQNMLF